MIQKRKLAWNRRIASHVNAHVKRYAALGAAFVVVAMTALSLPSFTGWSYAPSIAEETNALSTVASTTFPIGVHPRTKTIEENPAVLTYFTEHIADSELRSISRASWRDRLEAKLALFSWYQNLASASARTLVIFPGERKEQVAAHFGKILGWDAAERALFLSTVEDGAPGMHDGVFAPGKYTVPVESTPEFVAGEVRAHFTETIGSRYTNDVAAAVPLKDALIIASLLEREAGDFDDMRQVAGVIWNRLFIGMKLQIDATLQYAKASDAASAWWPKINPDDKYIESAFNTYQNEGLPPEPIANPASDAVLAALNPRNTECYYYFHDHEGVFHCSATYEGHVKLLREYYGQGR